MTTLDERYRELVGAILGADAVPAVWIVIATSSIVAFLASFVAAFLLYYDDDRDVVERGNAKLANQLGQLRRLKRRTDLLDQIREVDAYTRALVGA